MGAITDALARHPVIGLDTAPFIYLFERHPRYFPLVEELFRALQSQPTSRAVTSLITLIEACVLPQRSGRMDLARVYEDALLRSRVVQTLPIDLAVARQAIDLRARYDLRVPDAIQIAAALEGNASGFITNDRRLRRVTELEVLVLEDLLSNP